MSSTKRATNKPRLSVAMDVDPRDETPMEPSTPAQTVPTTRTPETTDNVPPARVEVKRSPAKTRTKRSTPAKPDQDPSIQEINGRTYVLVGDDLLPEGARVQMTVALTALERHNWLTYAEEHNLTIVEVLRRAMKQLLE